MKAMKYIKTGLLLALSVTMLLSFFPTTILAHEPIFGLGPHTVFKGGFGIETEYEWEKVTFGEKETSFNTEIMYGVTGDLAVTLAVPTIFQHTAHETPGTPPRSGLGDILLRIKYRFWRDDKPGIQDGAAVIVGAKLPTGDYQATPPLGSGSTDYLFALAAARESRRWYYFADTRYRLNTQGDIVRFGNRFFADVAFGVRPWLTEYLKPDLVVMVEANWEFLQRNKIQGVEIPDSGGEVLFISPGFFLTLRNWALKGGIQLPINQNPNGHQGKTDFRFALAIEIHL